MAVDHLGHRHEGSAVVLCVGDRLSGIGGRVGATLAAAPLRRCRLQMLQTAPAAERLTTAVADADSMRYYPAFDLPARAGLPEPATTTAEWGMQLLIAQRAAGGLTIGDTHVYDEPFDFAVEEPLYEDLVARAESVLGWSLATGGAPLGRRVHRRDRRPHLLPDDARARCRRGDGPGRPGHDPVAGHRRGDLGGSDPMTPPIRLAALDMAGTTVADEGAVEEAFQSALDAVGLVAGDLMDDPGAYIRRTMGQSKIVVFTELLGGDRHRAERANTAFEAAFDQAVDRGEVTALPGRRARPSPRCATPGCGSA